MKHGIELDKVGRIGRRGDAPRGHPSDARARARSTCCSGRTRAGKTSLLRLMAGLDRPDARRHPLRRRRRDALGVRRRNVAMVYQQFINYPSLTVYENIASPLRLAGKLAQRRSTGACATQRRRSGWSPSSPAPRGAVAAASSSARRWRGRWSRTPSCCCSTSRSPTSTTSCAKSCATEMRQHLPASRRRHRLRHHRAHRGAAARRHDRGARTRAASCRSGPRSRSTTRPRPSAWARSSAIRR